MKVYLIQISLTIILFFGFLEVAVRTLRLVSHRVPEENINGNLLRPPGLEGHYIRGNFKEIEAEFRINPQGFNSIYDYSENSDKIRIALVGDSFIEGFHVSVQNSIGRIVEDQLNQQVVIHEYGKGGGNAVDFKLLISDLIQDKYDLVFILLTNKHLEAKTPSFMHQSRKKSSFRKFGFQIINLQFGLNYLETNFQILNTLFSIPEIQFTWNKDYNDPPEKGSSKISGFNNCFILYESTNLDTNRIDLNPEGFIRINHKRIPFDFGFDGHWNLNGRKNCADAIVGKLEQLGVVEETAKE